MKLDKLHVLQRQAGAQDHTAAITSTRVCGGAGKIGPTVSTRGQYDFLRPESVDRSILESPGHHTPAGVSVVHNEIERKIFDKKFGSVFQRLLIQGMQYCMTRPIRCSTGPLRNAFAIIRSHAPEGSLVDETIRCSRKRHTIMFEFDNGIRRFLAHVFDRILVTEPVGTFDGVIHMPAPIVLAHIAKGRADSALGRNRVAAGWKNLGYARCLQPGLSQAKRRAQAGTTCTYNNDVVGVVDYVVALAHSAWPPNAKLKIA